MATFIKVSNLSGRSSAKAGGLSGVFQTIARFGLLIIGAALGIMVLLFAASAALVLVLSVVFIGSIVFAWFWARAKFFGKPFGGKAYQEFKASAESLKNPLGGLDGDVDAGDVLDAHKTPEGWSVDE